MHTGANPVIVLQEAADSRTDLAFVSRATMTSLLTLTFDLDTNLPSIQPELVVMLPNSESLQLCRRVVPRLRDLYGPCPILAAMDVVSGGVVQQLVDAGVDDIVSPCTEQSIRNALRRLTHPTGEHSCPPDLLTKLGLMSLLGKSETFLKAVAKIPHLGRSRAPILIQGETGTGKELFSRAIHYLSNRADGPFIAVNCGSFSDQLFENELFGHVKGAYTDAHADHKGLVAEAKGGTLFLDEINSLSALSQVKLLRFVENNRYKRVGSAREEPVDSRFIFATNVVLENEVERGRFREDLYYRINVLSLSLPPLRERVGDAVLLAQAFLDDFCHEYHHDNLVLNADARERLAAYTWPGNVRELRNVIERAAAMTHSLVIRAVDLNIPADVPLSSFAVEPFHEAKDRAIAEFERGYLLKVMAENQGNISKSARFAQKDRRSFQRLLRKYDIKI